MCGPQKGSSFVHPIATELNIFRARFRCLLVTLQALGTFSNKSFPQSFSKAELSAQSVLGGGELQAGTSLSCHGPGYPKVPPRPWGYLHLASSSAGGPGGERAPFLALAAPSAGSRRRPDSGAGRLHAGLYHHAGPEVFGWLPSAPAPGRYRAGPGARPDGVLSAGTEGHRVTGPLQQAPVSENMFGDGAQPPLSPSIVSESSCKSQSWIFHEITPKDLPPSAWDSNSGSRIRETEPSALSPSSSGDICVVLRGWSAGDG